MCPYTWSFLKRGFIRVSYNLRNDLVGNIPENSCAIDIQSEPIEENFPLILDNKISIETASMATQNLSSVDIFNSLRVPDAIKDVPKFEGNPKLLFEFINNVEEIRALVACTEGTPYGQLLLRAIRNKIVGPANEVLNVYGTSLVWHNIKENLILHYSDKRNETSLIRDLHALKQGNKTVENFYSEVIEILATTTNHIQIHESVVEVIKAKRDLYTEMCFCQDSKNP